MHLRIIPKKTVNIFIVFIACLFPVIASVHYVDNSDTLICADTPDHGSSLKPWRTIHYAITKIKACDTLRIKKGVYSQQYTLNIPSALSGSQEHPTVIEAYETDSVIISGPGVNGGRVALTGVAWLIFKKLRVTHYNQGIFIQGASHDVIIDSCEVYEIGQEAIHVKENSYNVTIRNCIIRDTEKWDYNGEGVYIGTGSGGPVDTTSNITVRGCTVFNTTDEAIELKPGTFNCTIENNIIFNSKQGNKVGAIEVNEHILGVQTAPYEPKHVIRNNLIYDITGDAIRAGTSCLVYNNVIYNASEYGIYINNSANDSWTRTVYHNTIDLSSANAIYISKGTTDIKNNIGPSIAGNLAISKVWFVSISDGAKDYHLIEGAPPVDAGVDLRTIVPTDKDGIARDDKPDMGAFEYKYQNPVKDKKSNKHENNYQPNPRKRFLVKSFRSLNLSPILYRGDYRYYDLKGRILEDIKSSK